MKFYFCEKCGVRLTEKDIAAGAGKDKKLAGVYCTACAAGVLTMELLPVTDEDIAEHKAAAKAPQPPHQPAAPRRPPAVRRTSSSATVPAHGSQGSPAHARPRREPHREPNLEPHIANMGSNKVPAIAFAAGGLLVVVALLVLFNSGGTTPNRSASTAGEEIPKAQTPSDAARAKSDTPAKAKTPDTRTPAPAKSEPPRAVPKAKPVRLEPHPRILQLPDNEDLKKDLAYYRPFEFGDVEDEKRAAEEESHLEEGLFGRAFRFNGKSKDEGGFIVAGAGIRNSEASTVALWIRCAAPSQQATVLENRNRYRLSLNGEIAVWNWTQGESNFKLEAPLPQAKQDWMHLAWTCDGKKGIAYLNGAPVSSTDSSGGMVGSKGDGGYTIRIGGRFLTSGMDTLPTFDGWIDELRVYQRALSPTEIALLAKDPRAK